MSYFLSYSRADQDVALRFANDLRRAGISIWVDQIDIKPSDRWDRAVENALRNSTGVVLIMSPQSVASENVMDEVGVALDSGKHVIPVLVEACQAPMRLARVQFIDATRDYAAALERCRAAMAASQLAQGQAAPAPAAPQPKAIPQNLIDSLIYQVTPFVGPIARHLVEHESRAAAGEADLISRISERVPSGAERDKFLTAIRSLRY